MKLKKNLVFFEKNLRTFRLICDIKTISMHGSPLSPYNNLDMWRNDNTRKLISDRFKIPVFAYQVSGEYSLIKNGIINKIINEDAIYESLISFKRAGANAVVTYFANKIAKDLKKNIGPIEYNSKGGWFGITDKYWLATLIPDQNSNVIARYQFYTKNNKEKYQVDYKGGIIEIPSNKSATIKNLLYAGAKEIKLLDKYEKQYSIPRLDFAIDFGWYYFLTKPFLYLLIFLS